MRQKIVAGNWKMNKTLDDGVKLVDELLAYKKNYTTHGVLKIIIPPFIHLKSITDKLHGVGDFAVGAQNCHHKDSGAFTGEISASMIASVNARYVIIGHSERRQYFNETNSLLKEKISVAINAQLIPIFCVGEKLEKRNTNKHFETVLSQLTESLFHLSLSAFENIIIAYEPVWAIGSGITATAQQAQEMHLFLRNEIAKKYGEAVASKIPILYGGSCNSKNARELFSCKDVDGGLIGGASLKAEEFSAIVNSF